MTQDIQVKLNPEFPRQKKEEEEEEESYHQQNEL